jgi:hypothetical protein
MITFISFQVSLDGREDRKEGIYEEHASSRVVAFGTTQHVFADIQVVL